jgi:hypothetical protein
VVAAYDHPYPVSRVILHSCPSSLPLDIPSANNLAFYRAFILDVWQNLYINQPKVCISLHDHLRSTASEIMPDSKSSLNSPFSEGQPIASSLLSLLPMQDTARGVTVSQALARRYRQEDGQKPFNDSSPTTVTGVPVNFKIRCRCNLGGFDTVRGNSHRVELRPCPHSLHSKCYSAFIPRDGSDTSAA